MKLSFLGKIFILFIVFNLLFGRVILAASPIPPTLPSTPLSTPTPPTLPTAPSLPSSADASAEPSSSPETTTEASNVATGADSTNQSCVDNQSDTLIDNQNTGEVTNQVDSQAVTGGNTASYNTGGGQITTGEANQSLNVVTNLNQNTTLSSGGGLSTDQAGNLLTGSGSENLSETSDILNNTINNSNLGNLNNAIVVNSISGENSSSYNTGNGGVTTGDANADLSLISALNTNVTGEGGIKTFNIYDGEVGDIIFKAEDFTSGSQFNAGNNAVAQNSQTGAESTNSATLQQSTSENVNNQNQAVLTNDITVNAVTGVNNSVKNTGTGDITSGDANAVASLVNFLNTNLQVDQWMIGVVNIFGEYSGDIILADSSESAADSTANNQTAADNSATGADSTNTSDTQNSNTATFTNYNEAQVLNNIETAAVTGANTASYNTGPGEIVDGNANVNTQVANVANNNIYAPQETLWLVLINNMGQWIGQIIGQDPGETLAGNLIDGSLSSTSTSQEQTNNSANDNTGYGSTNESSTSNENSESITNQNSAIIENNIKIVADTGDNSSSYNTLGGDITSGDANAALSLVNFVNNNIVGKKLVVLVVNVMDTWFGDVLPPDQTKTEEEQNSEEDNQDTDTETVTETLSENTVTTETSNAESTIETTEITSSSQTSTNSFQEFSANQRSNQGLNQEPLILVDFTRGLYLSAALIDADKQENLAANQNRVTTDWLYFLIPSLFGVVVSKNKKIRTMLFSFL